MGRPKSKGAYAPLAAQYYLDDAILEAGPNAELLWVRVLSFLASKPTDGFVTEKQLGSVGIGLRDWRKRVDKLQEVGLLIAVDGGFTARSWLKWNRTAAEQNKLLAQDRERKARNHAEKDDNSDRKTEPFRSDSSARTEQNRTEQNKVKESVHATRQRELANEFDEWWKVYPKKQGKEAARRKYLTVRKTVDAKTLLDGARNYALMCAGEDKQFVKLPAGWLNDGRWADEHGGSSNTASPRKDPLIFCLEHDGYTLPCGKCEREAQIPEGNQF